MGNSSSAEDDHHHDEYLDPFDGIDTLGYRVLGVQPNSPASKAGLVSFLDFLVGANERMLLGSGEELQPGDEYDDIDLPGLLHENKGKPVEFLVWNIKSQKARLVKLTPDDTWGGAGLLGVTIRLDNYAGAEERLIRILEVEPNSPAAICGLVPLKDFLLGTTHETTDSAEKLATVLRQYEDTVVEFYVYNTDSDLVRVVALMPTLSWGGRGLLGAEIGTGYLHRLPHAVCQTAGASVERKVRYVKHPPHAAAAQQQPTNDQTTTANPAASLATEEPVSTAQEDGVLEMEPQLEMEVTDDEEEGEETGSSQQQPQQQPQQQQQAPVDAINQERVSKSGPTAPAAPSAVAPTFLPPPPPPRMNYKKPPGPPPAAAATTTS